MGYKVNFDNYNDYCKNFWFDFCIIIMFIILKFVILEKRFNELYLVVCKMWYRKIFLEVYVIIVFGYVYFVYLLY